MLVRVRYASINIMQNPLAMYILTFFTPFLLRTLRFYGTPHGKLLNRFTHCRLLGHPSSRSSIGLRVSRRQDMIEWIAVVEDMIPSVVT